MFDIKIPRYISEGLYISLPYIMMSKDMFPNSNNKIRASYIPNGQFMLIGDVVNAHVFFPDRTHASLDQILGFPKLHLVGNQKKYKSTEPDIAYPV